MALPWHSGPTLPPPSPPPRAAGGLAKVTPREADEGPPPPRPPRPPPSSRSSGLFLWAHTPSRRSSSARRPLSGLPRGRDVNIYLHPEDPRSSLGSGPPPPLCHCCLGHHTLTSQPGGAPHPTPPPEELGPSHPAPRRESVTGGKQGARMRLTPGVGDGQGGLTCCDSWGHKESDTTEPSVFPSGDPGVSGDFWVAGEASGEQQLCSLRVWVPQSGWVLHHRGRPTALHRTG